MKDVSIPLFFKTLKSYYLRLFLVSSYNIQLLPSPSNPSTPLSLSLLFSSFHFDSYHPGTSLQSFTPVQLNTLKCFLNFQTLIALIQGLANYSLRAKMACQLVLYRDTGAPMCRQIVCGFFHDIIV